MKSFSKIEKSKNKDDSFSSSEESEQSQFSIDLVEK